MELVVDRIGIRSFFIMTCRVTRAANLGRKARGQSRGLNDRGDFITGNCLHVVASRSMTGFTGNTHLNKGLFLRIYAGCVASGTLIKPDSFLRLIGEIGFPLTGEDIILGREDDEIAAFFFQILLFPLTSQSVGHIVFGKCSDLKGAIKIAHIGQWLELDIPHHPGVQRCPPFQISPFMTLLTGFRAHECGTGSVFELSGQLPGSFMDQVIFQGDCRNDNNDQRKQENSTDNHGYFGQIRYKLHPLNSRSPLADTRYGISYFLIFELDEIVCQGSHLSIKR